jgi:hypothetical protein
VACGTSAGFYCLWGGLAHIYMRILVVSVLALYVSLLFRYSLVTYNTSCLFGQVQFVGSSWVRMFPNQDGSIFGSVGFCEFPLSS